MRAVLEVRGKADIVWLLLVKRCLYGLGMWLLELRVLLVMKTGVLHIDLEELIHVET